MYKKKENSFLQEFYSYLTTTGETATMFVKTIWDVKKRLFKTLPICVSSDHYNRKKIKENDHAMHVNQGSQIYIYDT